MSFLVIRAYPLITRSINVIFQLSPLLPTFPGYQALANNPDSQHQDISHGKILQTHFPNYPRFLTFHGLFSLNETYCRRLNLTKSLSYGHVVWPIGFISKIIIRNTGGHSRGGKSLALHAMTVSSEALVQISGMTY